MDRSIGIRKRSSEENPSIFHQKQANNSDSIMQTPHLSAQDVFKKFESQNLGSPSANYLAMYSSWLGGIVTDPALMLLPIDDHMVHRGDGVFEAIKVINGGVYLLEEHLDRLTVSASKIDLKIPWSKSELKELILETCRAAFTHARADKGQTFTLRLFVSRGPGSFGPSPYDTVGSQFYCILTKAAKISEQKYSSGVSIGKSLIPVKPLWYPTVKSCNYLPNVLMKKESVDRKLDFTVSYTEDGFVAEGSTENIFILDRKGILKHPGLDYVLKGTMLARLFDLAEAHTKIPVQRSVDISESELLTASGIFMAGTTMDILPVTEYEGKKIKIPEEFAKLHQLLKQDQIPGSKKLTVI
jgi:4-amino-4-deoxychorismate lyase